jgi:hypothetical protein
MAIAIFDDFNIRFEYPLDWELDVGEDGGGRLTVNLQAPNGLDFAFVQIDDDQAEPGELADEALEAMRAEYPALDAIPARETIAGREAVGYDIDFFSLDVPNMCGIRSFRTSKRTILIFVQWSELLEDAAGEAFRILRRSIEETDT